MPPTVLNAPRIIDRSGMLLVPVAHPAGSAAQVAQQIARTSAAISQPLSGATGKRALVLGSTSFGYGSSGAIALRQAGMEVIGLGFETPPEIKEDGPRKASPGWYLTGALHQSFPGSTTYLADGFADETRDRVIADLRAAGRGIDLLYYSVAAPARSYRGQRWASSLKVLGGPMDLLGLKFTKGILEPVTLQPGTLEEAENTRRVMGGEDLEMWVSALLYAGLLNEGATVVALSYIGPEFEPLRRIYWNGTIGAAKQDIDQTTARLNARLARQIGGQALTAMFPAVVTAASIQIPIIVRYLSMLLGAHEAGIWQYLDPLAVAIKFTKAMYDGGARWKGMLDAEGRLRMDDHELVAALQDFIQGRWGLAQPGALDDTTALGFEEFKKHFGRLFGFDVSGVDYEAPAEFDVPLGPELGVHNLIGVEPAAGLYLPRRAADGGSVAAPIAFEDTVAVPAASAAAGTPAPVSAAEGAGAGAEDNEEGRREVQAFFDELRGRVETGVRSEKGIYSLDHTFSPDEIAAYERATNNPEDGPFDWVPPEFTFVIAYPAIVEALKPLLEGTPAIIHLEEEIERFAPISSQSQVRVEVERTDVRDLGRRGRVVTIQRKILNASGAITLATGKTTLFLAPKVPLRRNVLPAQGVPVGSGALVIGPEKVDGYLLFDNNIVHRSDAAARALGLPGRIVHGMWTMRLASRVAMSAAPVAQTTPPFPRKVVAKFTGFVRPNDSVAFDPVVAEGSRVVKGRKTTAEGDENVIEVTLS